MSANRLELNADTTELLWSGYSGERWSVFLQLGTEAVAASDQVRVLSVTMTSDLSVDKHVANVCATCFYWLRQL